jgi:hypothetical protein
MVVYHRTSPERADDILTEGMDPECSVIEGEISEVNRKIDEHRPDSAPRRTCSNFFSLGGDMNGQVDDDSVLLSVDLRDVDDCQCVAADPGHMGDLSIHLEDNSETTYIGRHWEDATLCEASECESIAHDMDSFEREIYCGCEINPDHISETTKP